MIYIIYQHITNKQPWIYVTKYNEMCRVVYIRTGDILYDNVHCLSRIEFISKSKIENNVLKKNTVGTYFTSKACECSDRDV